MQSTGFVVAANSFLRSQNCNYHLKPTIMKPARDVVYRTAYDTSHILSKNSITGRYRCDELAIQSLLNCLIDRIDYSSENREGTNMIRLGRLDNQKEYFGILLSWVVRCACAIPIIPFSRAIGLVNLIFTRKCKSCLLNWQGWRGTPYHERQQTAF